MPDNPTLLQQLATRAKAFHGNTGISQTQMARAIHMEPSNYNSFLQGNKGLGAESTCLLLQFISMPKREVIAKFSKPAPASKILHFQQNNIKRMRLDNDGYVPGQSGIDPNDSSTIDTTDDADTSMSVEDTVATLRKVRSIHRKAIRAINSWILSTKVNQGSTPVNNSSRFSARRILKSIRFAKEADSADTTSATQDLLDTLGQLDVVTRRNVIAAILAAFPNSVSLR